MISMRGLEEDRLDLKEGIGEIGEQCGYGELDVMLGAGQLIVGDRGGEESCIWGRL